MCFDSLEPYYSKHEMCIIEGEFFFKANAALVPLIFHTMNCVSTKNAQPSILPIDADKPTQSKVNSIFQIMLKHTTERVNSSSAMWLKLGGDWGPPNNGIQCEHIDCFDLGPLLTLSQRRVDRENVLNFSLLSFSSSNITLTRRSVTQWGENI